MLASWVLPGWMSDTQEQLKETLGMVVVVVVVVFLFLFCFFCFFPLCSILALERRDSWEAEEESVCMFGRGGGVGSESAKNRAWKSVCVCVCGTGKQATHRNGILLKLV